MDIAHKIPRHVAIIMDGNGRWAQQQGKERVFGHARGADSLREVVKGAIRNKIKYLTLYAFSTENWGRPAEEVDALMELLCNSIIQESPELVEQGVKVDIIGDESALSDKVRLNIHNIKEETCRGEVLTLILAINYSSRWEVARMARLIGEAVAKGELVPENIDYSAVKDRMATRDYPDPDLLIRTGGEYRLSNFLLLQLAYSELYFTDTLWPDFGQAEFDLAIAEYQKRNRRYGVL